MLGMTAVFTSLFDVCAVSALGSYGAATIWLAAHIKIKCH